MAGYTRQDTNDNIATGKVINASDFDNEFDQIVAAFHASTGHSHDGTAAEGPRITVIGPSGKFSTDANAFFPTNTTTVGLGKTDKTWTDLYVDNIKIDGNAISSTDTDGNISLTPNGAGSVILPKAIQIQDTSADHQYVLAVSELAADRTVTLPLLGGNDEFVFKDHAQTLTSKTLTTTDSINTGTGFVAIKNGGARSELRLYCESNNAHYLALQAPAHADFGGNPTLTFPAPPVNGSDTLISRASTDTLTNKTLTAPKFADAGFIADANGNEMIVFQTTSSAENALEITNGATGGAVVIGAFSGGGEDANIDITITPKGTGEVNIAQDDLNYGGDTVTASGAKLNYVDITTLGTSQASKAVTADANGDVTISEELTAKSYNETHATLTSASTVAINFELGNVFLVTAGHNITFTFSNPPANTLAYGFTLKVTQDGTGSRTLTWPSTVRWAGGSAPDLTGTASSVDVFTFFTHDAGSNYYGFLAASNLSGSGGTSS